MIDRIDHVVLTTRDKDACIRFYTEVLGMKLLRRKDYPDGKFTLAFVGYGDESDELRFSSSDEFIAEALQVRIMARGHHGADEQGAAHALATAADEALAAPLPGLTGPGREPDKGRDLSTVERTEFRQFGNQGPGDCLSDTGHGREEILFLSPDGRSTNLITDQGVQLGEFFLQRLA